MCEFMYGKKNEKDTLIDVIDRYKDEYNLFITYKPKGIIEIYMGSKREESEGVND